MPTNFKKPETVLKCFRLNGSMYALGSFEKGVTVFNQQVRALNLAWALCELPNKPGLLDDVAVVGGGIAGITFAAGLLKKGVPKVTIFEKRPVLCPLQQGSDTRWVHPHIYEWPKEGTENPIAGLPIMNWRAGRASDVVQQLLDAWDLLKRETFPTDTSPLSNRVAEITGTSYLKVNEDCEIEWVRASTTSSSESKLIGSGKQTFSLVVFALGFGEETVPEISFDRRPISYWRNESLGQPHLTSGRRNFVISGYGDGALIDLCRIRIAGFRQERTLWELFAGYSSVRENLKQLKTLSDAGQCDDFFADIAEVIGRDPQAREDIIKRVSGKLRQDTFVILAFGIAPNKADPAASKAVSSLNSFSEVFNGGASFQNKVLLYLLFCAGGFVPSPKDVSSVVAEYNIDSDSIVARHGTKRKASFEEVLTQNAYKKCEAEINKFQKLGTSQPKDSLWAGGFWDTPLERYFTPDDKYKASWRQEYLPAATQIFCSAFAAAIAAKLKFLDKNSDNRVTVHRIISIGSEILLQQACDYFGTTADRKNAAGRVFTLDHATIGLSALRSEIVCSDAGFNEDNLKSEMELLKVGGQSRKMSENVRSFLTIPILSSVDNATIAVIFMDTFASDVFSLDVVKEFISYAQGFADSLDRANSVSGLGIQNIDGARLVWSQNIKQINSSVTDDKLKTVKFISFKDDVHAPVCHEARRVNLDSSEFSFSEPKI